MKLALLLALAASASATAVERELSLDEIVALRATYPVGAVEDLDARALEPVSESRKMPTPARLPPHPLRLRGLQRRPVLRRRMALLQEGQRLPVRRAGQRVQLWRAEELQAVRQAQVLGCKGWTKGNWK
jgi:hypothetical protein